MVRQLNNVSRTVIFLLILVVGVVFSTTVSVDAATNYYPATVKNVKAVSSGHDAVKVTWGKTARADGYKVYRATAKNGKYSLVKTTTARSFTNTKLKANKTYYYKVKAYNKVKIKGKTKTYLSKKFSSKVYAKPTLTVGKAAAKATAYNKVYVSWGAGKNVKAYQVYRSTSKTGKYTKVKTTTARSFTDTVATDKTYYYKVRAYNARGNKVQYSTYSNIAGVKLVSAKAPTSVAAKATAYNKAYISWNTGTNAKGYILYRATSKTGTYTKVTTTTSRSFIDTVAVGQTYYYKVKSYSNIGSNYQYSGYSKIVSVKTELGYSTNVTAMVSGENIVVKWSAVPGANKYIVHRDDGTRFTVTGTSYTDTTANDGNYYAYCVRALRDGVYGDWSEYSEDVCIIPEDDPIVEPEDPVEPEEPTEPDTPVEPEEPIEPEQPVEPEEPTTPSEPVEPSTPVEPETPSEPEQEPGYINYSKDGSTTNYTKLYIGQEWSDSLNAALNGGTPVEKLLTRTLDRSGEGSQDLYVYDTIDFDNFLIVYVKGGKVIAWQTTSKVMGVYDGVELVRGTPRSEYSQFSKWNYGTYGEGGPYIPESKINSVNISVGDIYFGGIVEDSFAWGSDLSSDFKAEELLCEYTVNAFRVVNGKSVLAHNDYLYGDGSTYGAKAWSATQAASETQGHGVMPAGPLANIETSPRNTLIYNSSGKTVVGGNENVATNYSGEFVVDAWFNSAGHSGALMAVSSPQDCYPTSIHAAAVDKSAKGSYYWTWANGNIKIDYGIKTPEVTVVEVTDTTATLQWSDVLSEHGSSAYKYQVEFYTDAEYTTGRKAAETSMNPYTRKSLVAGTTYYYRVRAGITVDSSYKWGEWATGSFTTTGTVVE